MVPGQMYLWGGVGIFVLGHFYPGYRGILVRVREGGAVSNRIWNFEFIFVLVISRLRFCTRSIA